MVLRDTIEKQIIRNPISKNAFLRFFLSPSGRLGQNDKKGKSGQNDKKGKSGRNDKKGRMGQDDKMICFYEIQGVRPMI